ncbi:hypothetical protein SKAU_G00314570 [Synaphobranchus kaupii]|uniref:Uncharacterized protein n=1 Tax=Synaphobranchus kaupii TaxID=118154 RepID=A0A9Q1ILE0_SYNKA|nr:hypothetical protein SKAU_G00314570 [Synaphobranchus kaupii]
MESRAGGGGGGGGVSDLAGGDRRERPSLSESIRPGETEARHRTAHMYHLPRPPPRPSRGSAAAYCLGRRFHGHRVSACCARGGARRPSPPNRPDGTRPASPAQQCRLDLERSFLHADRTTHPRTSSPHSTSPVKEKPYLPRCLL